MEIEISRLVYEQAPHPIVVMPKDYPSGHVVPLHRHERGQLIYAVAGVMEIKAAGGLWLVPPQRALWMPPDVDHSMRGRGSVSLRTVYVRVSDLSERFPSKPRAVQVSPLLRELLQKAATLPLVYKKAGREARLLRVLLDEIEWAPDRALHLPTGHDKRLVRVCRALLAEPGNNQSFAEWAAFTGTSSRTLARLFQAELGTSFLTWRQQVRILAAIPRVAAGEPITAIAADLGYDTPGAFAAMFRRLTGSTPSQYFP